MTVASLLASIAIFVPVQPVPIIVQSCPGVSNRSCVTGDRTMYLDPGLFTSTRLQARVILGHEEGHEYDLAHFNDADRARWMKLAHLHGPWWPTEPLSNDVSMITPPVEQFADAFALCAIGPKSRRNIYIVDKSYVGTYGESVSRRVVAITCWWVHNHEGG